MVGPRLDVTTSDLRGSTLVGIEGEIDLSTASQLEKALLAAAGSGKPLLVDLRKVEFMDSMGIGVLVRTSKKLGEEARAMSIVCAAGQVRRVLTVSGLDAMIPVFADLDAAADA